MSERLTRKEMKQQDGFQVAMGRTLDTVQRNRRQIVLFAVVLVVLVAAVIGWFLYAAAVEGDAQAALSEGIEIYSAPLEGEDGADGAETTFPDEAARTAAAEEAFEGVVDEYGLSDAADVARVYLGDIAASRGDTERASELWRDFLDEHPDHMVAAQVRLNLYALDRAAGRGEQVAAELEEMVDDEDRALPLDVALFELATTLESLGREEDAGIYYQRLVDEFGQSPYAAAARAKTGGGMPAGFPGFPS
jgi:tetratricopeptide (TPR) repeat protein